MIAFRTYADFLADSNAVIFRNYYAAIPSELIEAADALVIPVLPSVRLGVAVGVAANALQA